MILIEYWGMLNVVYFLFIFQPEEILIENIISSLNCAILLTMPIFLSVNIKRYVGI
jgi:hypothetical protein